jgi:fimbrial chaperone protein
MRIRTLAGGMALAFYSLNVWAYSFSPQLMMLTTAGDSSGGLFFIDNKNAKPIAIELSVYEHSKDLDGNGISGKVADQDFIVYPSQLILMPNEQATVQIKWVGTEPMSHERAFSVRSQQVEIPNPVNQDKGVNIGVTVLMNYEARLYVAPPAAKAALVVESVSERRALPQETSGSGNVLDVIVHNTGNRHADLSSIKLQLFQDSAKCKIGKNCVQLDANTLANTKSHVLAGQRRHLVIDRPASLSDKPISMALIPK